MRLVSPADLWWLVLLALPPLLSRWRIPPSQRVVANLYMWRHAVERDAARLSFRRLRRTWLVLLQMAVLAVTIVALSGPMAAVRGAGVSVVMDVSMSMGARDGSTTRLGLARERALALLDRLPRGTAVRLIAAAASPHDLGEHMAGDRELEALIEGLTPTAGPSDLALAIGQAPPGAPGRQTYVFTDRAPPDSSNPAGTSDSIRWTTVGQSTDNLAVARIAARRHPVKTSEAQVLVEVANFGTRAADAEVELAQDSVVLGRRKVTVPAHESGTILYEIQPIGRVVSARLVDDDALAADNRRLTVIPSTERTRVRLVTAGNLFLEKALSANPRVALEVMSPSLAQSSDGATPTSRIAPEVVVCDQCDRPPDSSTPTLITRTRRSSQMPALLGIARLDHPVVASLEVGNLVAAPSATDGVNPAAEVLLRAGDAPAVLADERDGQRILEFRVDVAAPELVLSPAFPILVANAIDWLAARAERPTEVVSGEPMDWRLPSPFPAERVAVTGPDDRPVRAQVHGQFLTTADTDVPGTYRVHTPGVEELFVVNPAVDDESDLGRPESATSRVSAPAAARPIAGERDAAPWMLILALLLLAAEWHYSWPSSKRP